MNGLEILQLLKDHYEIEKDCYDTWSAICEIKPNDKVAEKYKSNYAQTTLLLERIINNIEEKLEDEHK